MDRAVRTYLGARAAALTAGAWLRGGELAGASETGATVLGLDCGLAVEVHQGTRNPLGWLAGSGQRFCGVRHGAGRR